MAQKLIEAALPLEKINVASAREKSIRHGHPSTLHLWWARRPLAAARAVIFAQMVDDPSAHPEIFKTEAAQEAERQRLFRLIEELVLWENTTNEDVLQQARNEIWRSWRLTCAENANHPRAAELFNPDKLPAFHDPFAGGGSLPLEAQRLGLESYASDLNPVAVLINKAMAVLTRYNKVLESDGTSMRVRTALQLINHALDEALAEQENKFDPDTRWALAWLEQMGFNDGPYGDAETLSKAKNTAVNGLVSAGVVQAKAGKVRLLRVDELPTDWNPATDKRLTAWETAHHLIRALNTGEVAAAHLAAQLGGEAEIARELAYRLYTICERKKRTVEALAYNGLVQSWPEIMRLARARGTSQPAQADLAGFGSVHQTTIKRRSRRPLGGHFWLG